MQSIVRELNNERIDIVPFSSNPEVFVTRALAPAKVAYIDIFDSEKKMTVAVEDEKLSLAIGKNGQNARLASKLTGWKVNIMSETEYNEARKREAEMLVPVGQLEGIGAKISERLSDADISSVQRLANASIETLIKIEGIGQKTAETLIEKAKAFVVQHEEDYRKKEKKAKQEAEKGKPAEEKRTADNMFADDEEGYVTEEDEVPKAIAPDFKEIEDEE